MKNMGIGVRFTFGVQSWVRGGKVSIDIHLDTDHASEGLKLGREVLFHGFHFYIYGGLHVFIDGGNIGTKLPHSLLGLYKVEDNELKWASKSWLLVWAMMKGEKRNVRVGPHRKWVMGEGYHDDQGNEGNPMGKGSNKGVQKGFGSLGKINC
jgi:hypothetical protein